MIVNNTYGFLFVHVPKSAGTSVSEYLSQLSGWCDLEVGGTDLGEAINPHFRQRYRLSKHSTAWEIRSVVGDELWDKYFTFGFVRNPYERVLSCYKFLRWMQADREMARAAVLQSLDTFSKFIVSDYFRGEGIDRLLMPQMFWLRAAPASEELGVKYVGRVENAGESMQAIAKSIAARGKPPEVAGEFPMKNASEESATVYAEMDAHPGMEEAIYWKYEVDFRVFGYERYVVGSRKAGAGR